MVNAKIQDIAIAYYSRKDIQEAIFKFCLDRETVPRYGEGFGKRPDTFQYPSDLIQQVRKGATSFHCSEELWHDPLKLSTDLSKEQLNKLRKGWDLLIDIDCPWFDIGREAAKSIIKVFEMHGIKNIGVKFSGGKGFHIVIPWPAFPETLNNVKTCEMFPEWPRIICEYLKEISRPILEKEFSKMGTLKVEGFAGIRCENCKNLADTMKEVTYYCERCRIEEFTKMPAGNSANPQEKKQPKEGKQPETKKEKPKKCPQCRKEMIIKKEFEFYQCPKCNIDSRKNSENFIPMEQPDIYKYLGLDFVLVSPRHLFRTPYSLHEKTALVSLVLEKNEIDTFQPKDADILKVKIKNFYPQPEKNEARELLIQALDWSDRRVASSPASSSSSTEPRKFQEINIDKSSINYPPSIKKILEGMSDGRKRALFILINFYRSIGFNKEETEAKIAEWNAKNEKHLKEGYIKSQTEWTFRQKKLLPPNYDKPIYKEIGINPDQEEIRLKNPVVYCLKKSRKK